MKIKVLSWEKVKSDFIPEDFTGLVDVWAGEFNHTDPFTIQIDQKANKFRVCPLDGFTQKFGDWKELNVKVTSIATGDCSSFEWNYN